MKKILSLCFVTALLVACGSSSRVASNGDAVDIGYGTQDPDHVTNSDATDPLILVDGVETTDLSGINPADVQSVDVIKDGTSAIYGMRGANGVIIIRTVGSH